MKNTEEQDWSVVIRPKEKLFSIDFQELWRYRDLCFLFIKRNIVVQYKQTILGPLWYIIQPILTVVMYMVVFGGIAGIPTDGVPQPLFYLAGVCMWQYFSDCLTSTSNTFVKNSGIFGKVYFPRLLSPISDVLSNLLRFAIQLSLFFVVYILYVFSGVNIVPNIYALLLPAFVIIMAGLALGFGVLISSLTTKYRDLQILFGFIVQLWMYGTPIVYPLSQVGDKEVLGVSLKLLMSLNPVTPIIESFKFSTMSAGSFIGWGWLFYSFVFMIVLLSLGVVVFNKVQKSFMDTV